MATNSPAQSARVNNYNRIPIGELGGLQGGALIARVNDASASWYNPAGLIKARRDSISGNASLYEQVITTVGAGESTGEFQSIPNFVGGVNRVGNGGDPFFVWGWSVVSPVNFTSSLEVDRKTEFELDRTPFDLSDDNSYTAENTNFRLSSISRMSILAPGISVAIALGDSFRIGIGVRMYNVELLNQEGTTEYQDVDKSPYLNLVRNTYLKGSWSMIRNEAGMQLDLWEGLSIGFVYKAPCQAKSKGTYRTYYLQSYDLNIDNAGSMDTRFTRYVRSDSDDVDFEYRLPEEYGIGLAWDSDTWAIEIDFKHYKKIEPFNLVGRVDYLWQQQTHLAGYLEQEDVVIDPRYRYSAVEVTNMHIGTVLKLTDAFFFNLGYYTDYAPAGKDNDFFDKVNIEGITLGFSSFSQYTSTSIGYVQTQGKDLETELEVNTYSIVIAGSFYY